MLISCCSRAIDFGRARCAQINPHSRTFIPSYLLHVDRVAFNRTRKVACHESVVIGSAAHGRYGSVRIPDAKKERHSHAALGWGAKQLSY
jgi:hypothetical protein